MTVATRQEKRKSASGPWNCTRTKDSAASGEVGDSMQGNAATECSLQLEGSRRRTTEVREEVESQVQVGYIHGIPGLG